MLESPKSPANALAGPSSPRRNLTPSSSRKRRDHRLSVDHKRHNASTALEQTLDYCVETGAGEASGTLDVYVLGRHGSTDTFSPRWIRRRVLNAQDEMVDLLNDVDAQAVTWALHRPTRGWYMHVRASAFPPGVFLDVQPLASRRNVVQSCHVQDMLDGTPLLLTISTRLQEEAFAKLKDRIVPTERRPSSPNKEHDVHHDKHDFTSITLDAPQQDESQVASLPTTPARTSARDDLHSSLGHTRRRSVGVTSNSPAHRVTSSISRRADTAADIVAEVPEEGEQDGDDVGLARTDVPLPETPKMAKPTPAARTCHIVIAEHRGPATISDGASNESATWLSWAKYALVEGLQSSGMATRGGGFSIWWIDGPSPAAGSKATDADASSFLRRIELLRFEDESSWWQWSATRRGRILVQQAATVALNIDPGLWIALGLGYLDFLDERNGYNAAADGG